MPPQRVPNPTSAKREYPSRVQSILAQNAHAHRHAIAPRKIPRTSSRPLIPYDPNITDAAVATFVRALLIALHQTLAFACVAASAPRRRNFKPGTDVADDLTKALDGKRDIDLRELQRLLTYVHRDPRSRGRRRWLHTACDVVHRISPIGDITNISLIGDRPSKSGGPLSAWVDQPRGLYTSQYAGWPTRAPGAGLFTAPQRPGA